MWQAINLIIIFKIVFFLKITIIVYWSVIIRFYEACLWRSPRNRRIVVEVVSYILWPLKDERNMNEHWTKSKGHRSVVRATWTESFMNEFVQLSFNVRSFMNEFVRRSFVVRFNMNDFEKSPFVRSFVHERTPKPDFCRSSFVFVHISFMLESFVRGVLYIHGHHGPDLILRLC